MSAPFLHGHRALTVLMLLVAAGCAVGPNYEKPPTTDAPPSYSQETNIWKVAAPQAHLPKGNWWELFGDPELNQLEAEAARANQKIKAAVAALDEARATLDLSRAGLFPHATLAPGATRERDSANRPINGVSNGKPDTFNNFSLPLDFTYELDVWGRVRRGVEGSRATLEANAADLETVRLGIQAEIATDYFALRALDTELALLRSNVEVFSKSLELTRHRRAGGVATDLDVSQAETILRTTQSQLPVITLQRRQTEHALAVLTGRPAPGFHAPEQPLTLTAPILPAGLPSELLQRRPDIAAAERRMAAANASIGIAQAAFYPAIRLNGVVGLQSVSASSLFDWPSRMWSVGPSISLPIFQGGQNRAALRQAQGSYDQVTANYRQTVLVAFGQVEDNLSAQTLLAAEVEAQSAAVRSARKTLEVAANRYRAGLVTYLEVATAQSAALDLERTAVRLRGEQLMATVSLIKSLGGGWLGSATPH